MGREPRLTRSAREWADQQREQLILGDSRLVLVELVVATAQVADRARLAGELQRFLSAASRLHQLIMAVERDRGDGGDGAGESGADAWSEELAELLGDGPEMVAEVRGEDRAD